MQYRIIDANINRACEAIRVLEDYCRFTLNHQKFSSELRQLRHELRKSLAVLDEKLISARQANRDIGLTISQTSETSAKFSVRQILTANFKRVQEALRSIEENLAVSTSALSKTIERLRFQSYTLEKEIMSSVLKELPKGLYGITAEKFSNGRKNMEVVQAMIDGGIRVIQYREKYPEKSLKEMYTECIELRKITADNGVLFIINDFVDLALMCDADGIHLGQDDWPIAEVRKIAGNKIIGLSTHSPQQAQNAVAQGADYIGVGPIYTTQTKANVCAAVGLEYLAYCTKNINLPQIAIGGIKESNLFEVLKTGAQRIALVTEIVGAVDITAKIRELNTIIEK